LIYFLSLFSLLALQVLFFICLLASAILTYHSSSSAHTYFSSLTFIYLFISFLLCHITLYAWDIDYCLRRWFHFNYRHVSFIIAFLRLLSFITIINISTFIFVDRLPLIHYFLLDIVFITFFKFHFLLSFWLLTLIIGIYHCYYWWYWPLIINISHFIVSLFAYAYYHLLLVRLLGLSFSGYIFISIIYHICIFSLFYITFIEPLYYWLRLLHWLRLISIHWLSFSFSYW